MSVTITAQAELEGGRVKVPGCILTDAMLLDVAAQVEIESRA
jgi:hypothetical protein